MFSPYANVFLLLAFLPATSLAARLLSGELSYYNPYESSPPPYSPYQSSPAPSSESPQYELPPPPTSGGPIPGAVAPLVSPISGSPYESPPAPSSESPQYEIPPSPTSGGPIPGGVASPVSPVVGSPLGSPIESPYVEGPVAYSPPALTPSPSSYSGGGQQFGPAQSPKESASPSSRRHHHAKRHKHKCDTPIGNHGIPGSPSEGGGSHGGYQYATPPGPVQTPYIEGPVAGGYSPPAVTPSPSSYVGGGQQFGPAQAPEESASGRHHHAKRHKHESDTPVGDHGIPTEGGGSHGGYQYATPPGPMETPYIEGPVAGGYPPPALTPSPSSVGSQQFGPTRSPKESGSPSSHRHHHVTHDKHNCDTPEGGRGLPGSPIEGGNSHGGYQYATPPPGY